MSGESEIRLLGSLEVVRDGRTISVSAPRLRGLLALLALAAGRAVPAERLVDSLWNDDLPANPRRSLHTYINRLRRQLGPGSIDTTPAGYRLRLDPDRVDAIRFDQLLEQSRRADDQETRAKLLDAAIELWRDVPFSDIGLEILDRIEGPRLEQLYLSAIEQRSDIDIAEHGTRMIGALTELTLRYPLRESLWVRLLVLLNQAGSRAEALERYEYVRTMIADELGSEPSQELQAVHAALLSEPAADRPGTSDRPAPPRQLPPDLPIFTGRETELAQLTAASDDGTPRPVVVVGTPGVGKTSLAVHAAHQLSDRFPDGQLYVNLRGFDVAEQSLDPADALQGLIAGVAPDQPLPLELDERAARYRTLFDRKRVLIILDNARSSDQVLPLLPPGPGSLVIITSRQLLTGVIAATGATPLVLDTVSAADAHDQLTARIGEQRVDSEPEATAALVHICSGLPLALSLVAARAAAQPQLPLSALVDEIHDFGGDLAAFGADIASADLSAVFSSSYASLGPEASRAFRLLGLTPGPDISLGAAASLLGLPVAQSRKVLAELCQAHLLRANRPGRYATHDLLHAYAAALAQALDSTTCHHAMDRLIKHYVYTSREAWRAVDLSLQSLLPMSPPPPGVVVGEVEDLDQAIAWWTDDHAQLMAAARTAAARRQIAEHTTLLLESLGIYFDLQGHWRDWQSLAELALTGANDRGDSLQRAMAQGALAAATATLGDLDAGRRLFEDAAATFERLDLTVRLAGIEMNLGKIADIQGDHATGARYAGRAADNFRRAGHERGTAGALGDLAWHYANLGRYAEGLQVAEEAAQLSLRTAAPAQLAPIRDTEGFIFLALGDLDRAIQRFRVAVDLYRSEHDLSDEADSLDHLGDAYATAGDRSAAEECWARAYDILLRSGHPAAAAIAPKLGDRAGTHED